MDILGSTLERRGFLKSGAGAGAALGLIGLSGCAGTGGLGLTDAIQRLLLLSSERAFARLTADGGYWDQQVGTVGLNTILGTRGNILSSILTSTLFKSQLQGAFADLAITGARRAAPLVADAVRIVGVTAAERLVRGGPTAATSFLRGQMGDTLVRAMVPELDQGIRLANNPVIGRALTQLTGVDVGSVVSRFSDTINNAIWTEMGAEERAIRADPSATNDPLLMGVFGLTGAL
ncbi:MAG: DUF4197 domain-containing protein [Parerythrobacter sp.]